MALKAVLEAGEHAKLPEGVREHYTASEDGKFVLGLEDVAALPDFARTHRALEKERTLHGQALSKLKSFEGLDPSAASDALRKVGEMANWTPEDKVKAQIESVKAQILAAAKAEQDKLAGKASSYQKQLDLVMRENALRSALLKAGAEEDGVELLLPHALNTTRLVENADGTFRVVALNAEGNERVTATGAPMGLDEHALSFRSKFPRGFKANPASGGGAGAGSGSGSASVGGILQIKSNDIRTMNANVKRIADGTAVIVND